MDKLDALIFIDTNIFLDFYRMQKSNISLKYLQQIEKHKDILITGDQVEMEFKKNRQKVLLTSLSEFNSVNFGALSTPPFLSEFQATKQIKTKLNELKTHKKWISEKIERMLNNPRQNDPVFKFLDDLFKFDSEYFLDRNKSERYKIRSLARKRFSLGYPPRKKNDTSIGDAVNWEWVISCASNSGKNIILVSRDSDYGAEYKQKKYLNDWLKHEFKKRVGRNRRIVFTELLSEAFKLTKIPIGASMIQEEKNILSGSASFPAFKARGIIENAQNRTGRMKDILELVEEYNRYRSKYKDDE